MRQSVTIPAPLAALAERGLHAKIDAKESLTRAHRRFMDENEPARKNDAGKDPVRAIFGKDAIAGDRVL